MIARKLMSFFVVVVVILLFLSFLYVELLINFNIQKEREKE
jgi:hypothetical protein